MSDSLHPVVLAFTAATAAAMLISLLRCLTYDRLLRAIIAKRTAIWERYLKPCGFFWSPESSNPLQATMARAGFYTTVAAKTLPWPEDDPEILRLHADYRKWVVRSHLAWAAFLIPLIAAIPWNIDS
jgi:hypothetical protein